MAVTGKYVDAGGTRLFGKRAAAAGADIDDGGQADAGALEGEGGPIGIVIVGEDDAVHAGRHAIALDERARRRGQHDAGPVIVGKGDRPLDGAGREHDLLGANLPQAVARRALASARRIVVGDPLEQHDVVVMPVADGGGARQDMHIVGAGEELGTALAPSRAGDPPSIVPPARSATPPKRAILVADDDAAHRKPAPLRRRRAPRRRRRSPAHRNAHAYARKCRDRGLAAPRRARRRAGSAAHRHASRRPAAT